MIARAARLSAVGLLLVAGAAAWSLPPVVVVAAGVPVVSAVTNDGNVLAAGGPFTGGSVVTVTGSGFSGASAVNFGSIAAASYTVNSDTQITATSPCRAPSGGTCPESALGTGTSGAVHITVTTSSGTSVASNQDLFSYGEGNFDRAASCPSCNGTPVALGNGKILDKDMVYDPAANSWTATGACAGCGGEGSTRTLLADGTVLWAGGADPNASSLDAIMPNATATDGSFIYDPRSGSWSPTKGRLLHPTKHHTASLLPSGKVLIAGGGVGASFEGTGSLPPFVPQNTAEIYDPGTGTWSATAPMTFPRGYAEATVLSTGHVLVVGGWNGTVSVGPGVGYYEQATATAELYDPTAGTWSSAGSMSTPRYHHALAPLPDGSVLAVGGEVAWGTGSPADVTADIFTPGTCTAATAIVPGCWRSTVAPSYAHDSTLSAVLPDGSVLVGGDGVAERYHPSTASWTPAGGSGDNLGASPSGDNSSRLLPLRGGVAICGTACGKVWGGGALYNPRPIVSGVTPASGSAGTTVTTTGTGLASVTKVDFGSTAGTSLTHDPANPSTTLTVVSPAGSGPVDVTVSSSGGVSAVSSADRFTMM